MTTYLTIPEAARRVGKDRSNVFRAVQNKLVPAIVRDSPRGKYYEIDEADLEILRAIKAGNPEWKKKKPKKKPRKTLGK